MGVIKGDESDDEFHIDDEIGTYPGNGGFEQKVATTPNVDCLQNKRVLFMGDSTLQEIVWRTLVLVNGTQELGSTNIPITQCHNDDCIGLAKNQLEKAKAHARCATISGEDCLSKLSVVKAAHFDAEFLWSGGLNPTDNFGGLNEAIYNEQWRSMFEKAKSRGAFDAVVFVSGNHDNVKKNYEAALKDMLPMLEPLSEKRVFLQTLVSDKQEQQKFEINKKTLEGRNWNMIERGNMHPKTHCAHIKYKNSKTPTWTYKWSPGCDTVVEAMTRAICTPN